MVLQRCSTRALELLMDGAYASKGLARGARARERDEKHHKDQQLPRRVRYPEPSGSRIACSPRQTWWGHASAGEASHSAA